MPAAVLPEGLELLHRYRLALSLALLVVTLYFILYSWLVVPPYGLFLGWKPDTVLSVFDVVEAEYEPYVQEGDRIQAINGEPVRRGDALFSWPGRSSYTFTIVRDGEVLEHEIPVIIPGSVAPLWKLSQSVLALTFWGIGLLTVLFARPDQYPALIAGLSFQLVGMGLVSSAPSQFGAPGAWIIGNCLIPLFPAIVLFLALFPRTDPLSLLERRLLQVTFLVAVILGLLAATEVLFLFPDNSVQQLVGISVVDILAAFAALGTVAAMVVLVVRMLRAPRHSYERQQLAILVFFFVLALAPLLFLVMLPLKEYVFVPYPLLFSLLLFMPAGYFFVLHRHGHLTLDAFFTRLITVAVLVIAATMAYATGAFLLERVFTVDLDGIEHGGLLFLLFAGVIAGQKPVHAGVELLLYGRDPLDRDSIQKFMTMLSSDPEPTTIARILTDLGARLQLQYVAVLAKSSNRYAVLAKTSSVALFEMGERDVPRQLVLRQREDCLAALPEWVEVAIPIVAREEQPGLLLLSRPAANYFDARQIARLREVADILAFGLLVIGLVAATQQLSQRMLYEKEIQRQQIAAEIHNEPLHTLSLVAGQLRRYGDDKDVGAAVEAIRQVTKDLRGIIAGLRPPALTKSVEWMVREVVRAFIESHPELKVTLDISIEHTEPLPDVRNNAVYYVLTEALNNIIRHAQAEHVHARLAYTTEQLTLEVSDDGIGGHIVAGLSVNDLLRNRHFGMADMHWWASLGGGRLKVFEGEHGGTVVKLILPVH